MNDLTTDYGSTFFYLRIIFEKYGLRFRKLGEIDFETLLIAKYVSSLESKLQAQLRRMDKQNTDNELYLIKIRYTIPSDKKPQLLITAFDPDESSLYKLTLKQTPIDLDKYYYTKNPALITKRTDRVLEYIMNDLCGRLEFKQYEDSGKRTLILRESVRFVDDLQKAFDAFEKGFDFFVNISQSALRFSREVDADGSRVLKHKVLESLRADTLLITRLINMSSRVDVVFESTGSTKSDYREIMNWSEFAAHLSKIRNPSVSVRLNAPDNDESWKRGQACLDGGSNPYFVTDFSLNYICDKKDKVVLYSDVLVFDGTVPRIKSVHKYNKTVFSEEEKATAKYYILTFRRVNGRYEISAYDPQLACQMSILNSDKDPNIKEMIEKLSKEVDDTGVIVYIY